MVPVAEPATLALAAIAGLGTLAGTAAGVGQPGAIGLRSMRRAAPWPGRRHSRERSDHEAPVTS